MHSPSFYLYFKVAIESTALPYENGGRLRGEAGSIVRPPHFNSPIRHHSYLLDTEQRGLVKPYPGHLQDCLAISWVLGNSKSLWMTTRKLEGPTSLGDEAERQCSLPCECCNGKAVELLFPIACHIASIKILHATRPHFPEFDLAARHPNPGAPFPTTLAMFCI
jgi:hypothetical protein